jgi:hypothetical protein
MQSIVHADIFFFVSTIALVVISAALLVALYYCVRILRDVREVVAEWKKVGLEVGQDVHKFRNRIKKFLLHTND